MTCPIGFGPVISITSNEITLPVETTVPVVWSRTPSACSPKHLVTVFKRINNLRDIRIIFRIRDEDFLFQQLFQTGDYTTECPSGCVTCEAKTNALNFPRPIKFIIKLTNDGIFPSEETYEFNFNTALDRFTATYIYPRAFTISDHACGGNNVMSQQVILPNNQDEEVRIEVPEIMITAQSDIFGNNLSDVLFEVIDNVKHRSNFPKTSRSPVFNLPCEKICKNTPVSGTTVSRQCNECPLKPIFIDLDKAKYTNFSEYPDLNSVLKGGGCNLKQKAESIIRHYGLDIQTEQLMINLIEYGMGKYKLSRLLLGRFSIKYLLRRYNEKFFEKLSHSRYCRFLSKFDNSLGYEKYFK